MPERRSSGFPGAKTQGVRQMRPVSSHGQTKRPVFRLANTFTRNREFIRQQDIWAKTMQAIAVASIIVLGNALAFGILAKDAHAASHEEGQYSSLLRSHDESVATKTCVEMSEESGLYRNFYSYAYASDETSYKSSSLSMRWEETSWGFAKGEFSLYVVTYKSLWGPPIQSGFKGEVTGFAEDRDMIMFVTDDPRIGTVVVDVGKSEGFGRYPFSWKDKKYDYSSRGNTRSSRTSVVSNFDHGLGESSIKAKNEKENNEKTGIETLYGSDSKSRTMYRGKCVVKDPGDQENPGEGH